MSRKRSAGSKAKKNIKAVSKQDVMRMSGETAREYLWASIDAMNQLSDEVAEMKESVVSNSTDVSKLREQLVANDILSKDDELPSDVEVADDDEVRPDIVQHKNYRGSFKPTVWFVDSENICGSWDTILARCVKRGDSIRYLYTSNSPAPPKGLTKMCRDLGVTLGYDACDCGKPNALDFQIVCAVSLCAAQQGNAYRYRIFSDDKGFTIATMYLAKHGYDARVISRKEIV